MNSPVSNINFQQTPMETDKIRLELGFPDNEEDASQESDGYYLLYLYVIIMLPCWQIQT